MLHLIADLLGPYRGSLATIMMAMVVQTCHGQPLISISQVRKWLSALPCR
jgi:hypothetical protein